jgi:M6 family metalloprotease-like protein
VDPYELGILMIIAGYENSYGGATACPPRIWGHAGSLGAAVNLDGVSLRDSCMVGERHASNPPGCGTVHQTTIGIICHELGHHTPGLPDLYDTDGSSEGIGEWGVMSSGNWNQSGAFPGDTPAHLTGWDKVAAGFVAPWVIANPSPGFIVVPTNTAASLGRVWVDLYKRGESFLLESRGATPRRSSGRPSGSRTAPPKPAWRAWTCT